MLWIKKEYFWASPTLKRIKSYLLFSFVLLASGICSSDEHDSIYGMWQISDHDGVEKSIIYIGKLEGSISGKVVQLFFYNTPGEIPVCAGCDGDLNNAPVIGIEVLSEIVRVVEKGTYSATLLDPSDGMNYKVQLGISKDGDLIISSSGDQKAGRYKGSAVLGNSMVLKRPDKSGQ